MDAGHPRTPTRPPGPAERPNPPAPLFPAGGSDAAAPIAGYSILGQVGRGGMGIVLKARHVAQNRLVAIKIMTFNLSGDPQARSRFRREAQAIARLKHPNIVQIYDLGECRDAQGSCPYMVLEYLAGGTLEQVGRRGLATPHEVAGLVEALARATDHAHRHGIIHRDLKPANVLLTADGVPKIADFGLAKLHDGQTFLTPSGDIVGTPNFMAPEQATGRTRDVGPLADVYALGGILYHLLTGRAPFDGESFLDILAQVRGSEPPPIHALNPHVPPDLAAICQRCLAKAPADRYPTAAALAEDLRAFQEGRRLPSRGGLWVWVAAVAAGVAAFLSALYLILGPGR
jgi:serine/threonine-protein kinase